VTEIMIVSGHAKRFDLREWDLVSRGKKTISAWLAEVSKGPICDRGIFPAIPPYSFTTHSDNEIDEHRHVE
jgi:hypothetical protein